MRVQTIINRIVKLSAQVQELESELYNTSHSASIKRLEKSIATKEIKLEELGKDLAFKLGYGEDFNSELMNHLSEFYGVKPENMWRAGNGDWC